MGESNENRGGLELRPYQRVGVDFLQKVHRGLLGDDMGTGKTPQALAATQPGERVLVVSPNAVKSVWRDEVSKWVPDRTVQVVEGDRETRRAQIASGADITIVNYELLITWEKVLPPFPPEYHRTALRSGKYYHYDLAELLKVPWDVIILDEAHRVKNRRALTTRMARLLTRPAKKVFLLTGTPILNRPDELWSLLNLLYPQQYSSFWRFVQQYCQVTVSPWGYYLIEPPTPDQLAALKRKIAPIFLRRLKSEVMADLPKKTVQQIWLRLEEDQARVYREMATRMWARLTNEQKVSTTYVIAQLTRLKQITVAPEIMIEDSEGISGVKISALLEILEGRGDQKVVVFSQYVRALNRLAQLLTQKGYQVAMLTGEMTGPARDAEIKRFREDQPTAIMLASIRAGGQGVDLSTASLAVFLDKDWTPAINIQAQDRLHRSGQANPVTVIELLTTGTVEEGTERLLSSKAQTFGELLRLDSIEIKEASLREILDPRQEILVTPDRKKAATKSS